MSCLIQGPHCSDNGMRNVFSDGKVILMSSHGEVIRSSNIGKVEVSLEEKENEIGIRIIMRCDIYDEKSNLIFHDDSIIAECEFNYANGSADESVIDYLSDRYSVEKSLIDIED